jgi:hypothetical protein
MKGCSRCDREGEAPAEPHLREDAILKSTAQSEFRRPEADFAADFRHATNRNTPLSLPKRRGQAGCCNWPGSRRAVALSQRRRPNRAEWISPISEPEVDSASQPAWEPDTSRSDTQLRCTQLALRLERMHHRSLPVRTGCWDSCRLRHSRRRKAGIRRRRNRHRAYRTVVPDSSNRSCFPRAEPQRRER